MNYTINNLIDDPKYIWNGNTNIPYIDNIINKVINFVIKSIVIISLIDFYDKIKMFNFLFYH